MRFNDRSVENTLLRLMTDGLLLAEIGRDRLLRRYDTIIVDEAHERSLNVDFLLGYLKRILPQRPDLKLIITSATIDPQRFAAHFDGAPVVEVSRAHVPGRGPLPAGRGRRPGGRDRATRSTSVPGDVLVFLSGEREIRDTAEALSGRVDAEILPLYARLATAEQQRVFHPCGSGRRVVLATNVAETSLTVPGIRSVVDPGMARISRYSARLKVQRLPIEPISQASADQRKGRCGRVADGVCVRLYDEEDFAERPRFTDPEILRTNLASVLLQMAALGLGEVEDFPFLDPPDARQVRDGVNLLVELGAFDDDRAADPARPPAGAAAGGAALRPHDPRGRQARLRERGDGDRRRARRAGPARAAVRRARGRRRVARALRRRGVGLPRLPEPVALRARAAAGAQRQPVPQAAARPSTCTTCACASGRTSPASCARPRARSACHFNDRRRRAAPRSTRRCSPGCSRTSACATGPGASTRARAARGSRSSPAPGSPRSSRTG